MVGHIRAAGLMNRDPLLRRGLLKDSEDFSALMLLSAPTLLPTVYGATVDGILKSLFTHRRNLYSFEHSYFVEVDGKNAGMLLGYTSRAKKEEALRTGLLLLRYMKARIVPQLRPMLKAQSVLGKTGKTGYYVSNVAAYPEYRGLGLGKRLLAHAEDEAARIGANRMVLEVELDNRDAIGLMRPSVIVLSESP